MDDFEQQLRRQPLNPPPANWRAEILEAARQRRTGLQPVPERTAKPAMFQEPTAQPAPASRHGQSATSHFGLRREAKRRAALAVPPQLPKAVSPLRSATAVQNRRASKRLRAVLKMFPGAGARSSDAPLMSEPRPAPAGDRLQTCPTLLTRFREWLWPHPAAWASLAAVWLLLFSVQRQTETAIQSEMIALRAGPEEVLAAFAQRQQATERLLAGLDFELPAMDRLKPVRRHPLASPPLMLLTT
jgi:hypothetical protein